MEDGSRKESGVWCLYVGSSGNRKRKSEDRRSSHLTRNWQSEVK